MPGIPLAARQTSYSRSADQMCRQDSQVHLSAEEELSAEESLSIYCKPVELYNILQRRAVGNPLFLQRCLSYKIQVKHRRRVQMTISLPRTTTDGFQSGRVLPMYVLLARLESEVNSLEHSAEYRYSRACVLTSFMGAEDDTHSQANFILPEINKLALEAKLGSLFILLVCYGNAPGFCVLGKIPMKSLYLLWEKSPNLSLGQRAEVTFSVDMHTCLVKWRHLNEDRHISVQVPYSSEILSARERLHVIVAAEEVGAKEKSPYNSSMCNDVISSSFSHIMRLRAGNVIFNYRYFNNKLQRAEVTEDFSCPFCLVKCASFKGLRYHLLSSHDLFNFEFWVTEEYQAVNVSVRTDPWRSEIVADGMDPRLQTFFRCLKPFKRKRSLHLVQNSKHVYPLILESELPSGVTSATGQSYADTDCVQSMSANNFAPPAMLQFAKTRKLSIERSEPRNRLLLQKRQFFHSHRAQPMAVEQVMSDRDSEDEVDDDVADFEDRRMLDDFVDVTKDEKQMMHLWNSFVRKQRVLADGHIPWACEAFSKLHGNDLVRAPALIWCWRLFMIKLWNHGLLDARTMNNCNITLEQCQNQGSDRMES
ncbi:polycomb group protein EMBRYONIC FLOWER 2 isoform X7 [Rhodamnia argentea]|uniref:Polycomb group protein EMBRYONIC FLOWER 2 isoform X7 n=1 Tax=Rhodamnia argentea TaxID=178133 RepID=A0A8B8PGE8_9MYRT|nr:polycomb group protein EMBRYONIC FLOWER 2 isoform X7 [Rhodamnia argentea]